MTGVKYTGPAKFSTIMEDLSKITNDEGKGSRHLRLRKASEPGGSQSLYTHDPSKWHGFSFIERWKKHIRAYEFVKAALVEEFGPKQAKQLLKKTEHPGRKAFTVADLHSINHLIKTQDKLIEVLPDKMHFVRHNAFRSARRGSRRLLASFALRVGERMDWR